MNYITFSFGKTPRHEVAKTQRGNSFQFSVGLRRDFQHLIREGEAPVEPLTAHGLPGGLTPYTLIKISADFLKPALVLSSIVSADN